MVAKLGKCADDRTQAFYQISLGDLFRIICMPPSTPYGVLVQTMAPKCPLMITTTGICWLHGGSSDW